jgi:hypothetical protein
LDRESRAKQIRRDILAAQLRVSLDKERGRETPEAVVRLSKLPLPEATVTVKQSHLSREVHLSSAG